MTTTVAPDLSVPEAWPTHDPEHAHTEREERDRQSFDPTQGRKVGSDPYDDPTTGRQIGSEP